MREIIKLKRVSVRIDAEACVTCLMRETWHLCTLNKNLCRLVFQVLILSHEDKSNIKMYINQRK